jgi:lipopolysaccharide export system protein LptA
MRSFVLIVLVFATSASAQALKGHNANAPVDFSADRIEVQDRADRVVASGNVRVTQGGLSLDAARLTIAYTGAIAGGNPTIQRLDASGGVTVRSASETASGSFAIYDLNRRLITMIGGVTLNRRSVEHLVLRAAPAGASRVDSRCPSAATDLRAEYRPNRSGMHKPCQLPLR